MGRFCPFLSDDVAAFIDQGAVLSEMPPKLAAFGRQAHFQFEGNSFGQIRAAGVEYLI